jgi:rubrerythrin
MEGSGRERLSQVKTIAEVLQTATLFEKTAMEFYSELVPKVSKPMRALVQELADEEALHLQMFQELSDNPEVHKHISERISVPASDHQFSDYIHLPDLGNNPDDQHILQYALGREHAAMEQYAALAKEVPTGPLKDVFLFLAEEELQHKKELEKRYYEIVHSGGV